MEIGSVAVCSGAHYGIYSNPFFNDRLFAGELPPCLVTLQRAKKAYGYFAGGRFGSKDGKTVTDEIALNPSHFRDRTTEQNRTEPFNARA